MALITGIIPKQNFEIVRDKIGEILFTELHNQYLISSPINESLNIKTVWVERCIIFDGSTQLPTVNVNIDKGNYTNGNRLKADGSYTFNIDIYTNAPTTAANGPGDQYAMVTMSRIAGMIRAILSNPVYEMLALAPGIIISTKVEGFYIANKKQVPDALNDVVGRLVFTVGAIETVGIYTTGAPITEATTKVYLNQSTEGFYYDFNPVA